MKKFILSLFLLTVFSGICFSQSKKFEGYDNMPWGTTLEEFKKQNPSAYDETKADNIIRNEKLYYKDGNSVTRVYRFFDNKLCWGRTVYEDPSEATCDAIIEKLKGKITIILTTHYMEEAESLSDKIGIMAKGRLVDIGTSQELIEKTNAKNFEDAFVKIATGGEL